MMPPWGNMPTQLKLMVYCVFREIAKQIWTRAVPNTTEPKDESYGLSEREDQKCLEPKTATVQLLSGYPLNEN